MLRDEVTSVRRSFTEDTSDDDLVLMMHKQVAHGPAHIAAKQELAARREGREQDRHRELHSRLRDLGVPHWSVPYTFWVASAAAVIALGAWFFPRAPLSPTDGLPSGLDQAPLLPLPPPARITAPLPSLAPLQQLQTSDAILPTPTTPLSPSVPATQDPKFQLTPPE